MPVVFSELAMVTSAVLDIPARVAGELVLSDVNAPAAGVEPPIGVLSRAPRVSVPEMSTSAKVEAPVLARPAVVVTAVDVIPAAVTVPLAATAPASDTDSFTVPSDWDSSMRLLF
jgi:hypothetical protein